MREDKQGWKDFKECGMLWWINMILHTFGWAIVVCVDDNGEEVIGYPKRVGYRGFSEKDNTEGYIKLSGYMRKNAERLEKESKE